MCHLRGGFKRSSPVRIPRQSPPSSAPACTDGARNLTINSITTDPNPRLHPVMTLEAPGSRRPRPPCFDRSPRHMQRRCGCGQIREHLALPALDRLGVPYSQGACQDFPEGTPMAYTCLPLGSGIEPPLGEIIPCTTLCGGNCNGTHSTQSHPTRLVRGNRHDFCHACASAPGGEQVGPVAAPAPPRQQTHQRLARRDLIFIAVVESVACKLMDGIELKKQATRKRVNLPAHAEASLPRPGAPLRY